MPPPGRCSRRRTSRRRRLALNPYAAPRAELEAARQAGELWRSGKLVRMDRAGSLPDRCIVCNAPAQGNRLSRRLYWSPPAWRYGSVGGLIALLVLEGALNTVVLAILIWPLALGLGIAHYFVRTTVALEIGICARHDRQREILRALSIAALIGTVIGILAMMEPYGVWLLASSIVALLVLAAAQAFTGSQRLVVKELSGEHVWLGRTGGAFRAALPELQE